MDKKKVKEYLIKAKKALLRYEKAGDKASFMRAFNLIQDAGLELSKSDWVSVEDGLPPYGEEVFVTSKMAPDNVFKNRRVECATVTKDSNGFIILWKGRMASITHWKPIEKLEK